jgi:hypothetical protein
MVQYFTNGPTVTALWAVTEGNLPDLATEITAAGQRTVTVVGGGLEWTGYWEGKRAEPGMFITMSSSGVPDLQETSPLDNGAQECGPDARYSFEP